MWRGQSADAFQNAACRNIFHGPLPPEAWRDRTVRQRDGVNLSEQRLRPNTFRREQALVFIGDAVSNHLLRCKTLLTEFFQFPYRPVSALLRSNRFSQCLSEPDPLMPECFRQPIGQLNSLRLEFFRRSFLARGRSVFRSSSSSSSGNAF
ncbi:Uncharacterised protein [Shigella sonnei]|nr:Uncharacterised protein [Shigella sonnei]CSF84095.1 Uncharacterised protein [Shigella sonnei]CSG24011.1 Uncharacterised protein [Shigella sonnei]CSG53094.1 Uncharacterised protein [Shigella sonnei]CSP98267.1 Uncharacterised protein [Shigella sonnei]